MIAPQTTSPVVLRSAPQPRTLEKIGVNAILAGILRFERREANGGIDPGLVSEQTGATDLQPAGQLALKSLARRCRFGWVYLLSFNLFAQFIEPRVNHLPAWPFIWAADLICCAVRIWLASRMSRVEGLTPWNIRLLGWVAPLHSLVLSVAVSLWYLTYGFDEKGLLQTLIVSGFALSGLVVYKPNLRILRRIVLAYLLPPCLTAIWMGHGSGWAVALHLMAFLIFFLYQAKVENFEFWEALHATRDIKIARLHIETAGQVQAELIANRARQSVLAAERSRIAAEWHDTLLAGFSAIAWQIETAQSRLPSDANDVAQALSVARTMLNHYRTEARLVIADLQSGHEDEDLKVAIARTLKPLVQGRPVRLDLEISEQYPALPSPKKHQLIRICHEAVANALQHASPKSITVKIGNEGSTVTLEVRDDGAGFHVIGGEPGHYGVEIMKHRATRIGGDLEISSEPGHGTKVLAKFPAILSAEGSMTRILIVEDQYFSRLALQSLLESRKDFRIVAEATTGTAGVTLFRQHLPDVTILDLRLPDISGLEVIKQIHAADPFAKVLVLTNFDGAGHFHHAMDAGATAYLTKDASGPELLHTIDAVLAGSTLDPDAAVKATQTSAQADLTRLERDILEQTVQGFSDRDIATRLGVGGRLVGLQMTSILTKLGAKDRAHAVDIALNRGIIDVPAKSSAAIAGD